MAVSDWSTNPVNNTSINGFSLSGPYGHVFAVLMAEIKAELDGLKTEIAGEIGEWTEATPARTTTVKAAIEAVESAVAGVQADIGAWTDETEDTTVKAAIEDLRPAGE